MIALGFDATAYRSRRNIKDSLRLGVHVAHECHVARERGVGDNHLFQSVDPSEAT